MNCMLFSVICFLLSPEIPDSLPVIRAADASEDYTHCLDNEQYRTRYGQPWLLSSSSHIASTDSDTFQPDNILDGDMSTAWVGAVGSFEEPVYVCVQSPLFSGSEDDRYFYFRDIYGDMERMDMEVFCISSFMVYNGWQQSPETWREYSRIKRILVWNNDRMYCVIELEDTMSPQRVDILRFTMDNRDYWHMSMSYGDSLKFEIIDVYPGDTYPDVGLSEILILLSTG